MKTIGDRIKDLRKKNGLTQEDLAKKCGYKSLTTINKIELGKIRITLDTAEKLAKIFDIPPSELMGWEDIKDDDILPIKTKKIRTLGEVACGEPIYCNEEFNSYIEIGTDIKADFCIKAKGDSMVGARINDGDIVFVREQNMVDNGEIAVVIIDNTVTLKRVYYYKDKNKLVLHSENPKYEPFVFVGEELNQIQIIGKAIAFQSNII